MQPGSATAPSQRGFTLIAVMLALTLLAIASTGVMSVASQQAQRERETGLQRVGEAYVRAIASFHEASPGSVKIYPRELSDLIEDSRYLTLKRHLRTLYDDPVTRGPLQVIRHADGTIAGVHSASMDAPLRSGVIELAQVRLAPAAHYADWKFVVVPAPPEPRR